MWAALYICVVGDVWFVDLQVDTVVFWYINDNLTYFGDKITFFATGTIWRLTYEDLKKIS